MVRILSLYTGETVHKEKMIQKLGVIYDFKRTMRNEEFAIATSVGLYFCTISNKDTVMSIRFNEEERYFQNQVIISFVEVNPFLLVASIWGSDKLKMIDRDSKTILREFHNITEVRSNNLIFRSLGFHDLYSPYLFIKDVDKISLINLQTLESLVVTPQNYQT